MEIIGLTKHTLYDFREKKSGFKNPIKKYIDR